MLWTRQYVKVRGRVGDRGAEDQVSLTGGNKGGDQMPRSDQGSISGLALWAAGKQSRIPDRGIPSDLPHLQVVGF